MLTEYLDAPVILETSTDAASPHLATIRGRFLSEGARSANKRRYDNIAPWIARAQQALESGTASYDMRTHHAGESVTEIVGKITKLNPDGTYEGSIANTPTGQAVLPLITGKYLKHVSLRARNATAQPLENEAGWTKITDVEGFGGIDFTNTPGIGDSSVAVAESADGPQVIASFAIDEREYDAAERKKAAKEGAAMPDGSFPIYTPADVSHSAHLWGNSTNPAAAKAHIIQRAKDIGATSELPYDWSANPSNTESTSTAIGAEMEPKTGIADAVTQANATVQESKDATPQADVKSDAGIAGALTSATEANKTPAPPTVTLEQALAVVASAELTEAARAQLGTILGTETTASAGDIPLTSTRQTATVTLPSSSAAGSVAVQESTPLAALTESPELKALVESLVEARMVTERETFVETLKTERAAAVSETIDQFLKARRKSIGITESTEGGEPTQPSLGAALKQRLADAGVVR